MVDYLLQTLIYCLMLKKMIKKSTKKSQTYYIVLLKYLILSVTSHYSIHGENKKMNGKV